MSCDQFHYTAKSGMCNCVYYFGRSVKSASQTGTGKIFATAKNQVNSKFFTGVSAIEYNIINKDHAMGLSVDCRNFWDGINNIVSRWKQGTAAGAQSATEWRLGQIGANRDELRK
ncbi:hypothetical protein BGZ50_008689 [Haplosporangium sp. Z 11]|nr:hypothetical protein BGZ50_008689 [Haplosporangium sp. Z 11]